MFTKKDRKKAGKVADKVATLKLTGGLKKKAATADKFIDLLENFYIPTNIELAEKNGEAEDFSEEVAMEIALTMKEVFKIQGANMGGKKWTDGLIDEMYEALLYKAVKDQFKKRKAVKEFMKSE